MIGTETLMDAFQDRKLMPPLWNRANLVDLAQAIGALCGVPDGELSPTPDSRALEDAIGASDHIVLALMDGVGCDLVESLSPTSFLRQSMSDELRTVFPSTTAVALTTLTTGKWPAEHGVTGWWTHLPQLGSAANILQYTARSDNRDLRARGIDPEDSFPVRSMWASIPRDVRVVVPERLANSVFSEFLKGGREAIGYRSLADGIDKAADHALTSDENGEKTFTYLYLPQVDSLAHLHGVTRPEVRHALTELDAQLSRLQTLLGDSARLVITADHGFLDSPAPQRYTLRPTRQLQPLLRFPPSGDARVTYLHTRDWARERVRRHIESRFGGDRFVVIDTEDAIAIGLFGPHDIADSVRERFADLMVVSMGESILEYNAARGSGRMLRQNSHHSGLSPQEMRIPLILA